MKTSNLNKFAVALILVALSPYAKASSLSGKDIYKVRTVLRAMNFDDSTLSNEQIQKLHEAGADDFKQSVEEYRQRSENGDVELTCGAGSHGGDNDPV